MVKFSFWLLDDDLEDALLDSPETETELESILVAESEWFLTIAVSQIAPRMITTRAPTITVGMYLRARSKPSAATWWFPVRVSTAWVRCSEYSGVLVFGR